MFGRTELEHGQVWKVGRGEAAELGVLRPVGSPGSSGQ